MATHSSILTWEIPWTEEPGGLQSMGSQRVRHDCMSKHKHIPQRSSGPTKVFSQVSPFSGQYLGRGVKKGDVC